MNDLTKNNVESSIKILGQEKRKEKLEAQLNGIKVKKEKKKYAIKSHLFLTISLLIIVCLK